MGDVDADPLAVEVLSHTALVVPQPQKGIKHSVAFTPTSLNDAL